MRAKVSGSMGLIAVGLALMIVSVSPAWADSAAQTMTPQQRVDSAPKGTLKNPYRTDQQDKVKEGHELFMSYSCNGCHGGTGGGGMCPPLTGDVWFYGIDDDTLFRLVTLGSLGMDRAGFQHLGGPGLQMPPFASILKSDDELWKILTWIRTVYKGDPKKKTWE
ncbi:MAG TPA: c-type cytochrome [Steroidobacteraceae bacterium]|jgi:mono/diheme cytochrome c family protein